MAQNAKILVVDDDRDMTLILNEILTDLGLDVTIANHAEEAIEHIETEEFYIVITDIHMPGMSGVDLLRFCRQFNNLIQVFIMTAHSNKQNIIECLKAGAADYFEKPFHTEDVVASIQAALHKMHKWAKLLINAS